MQSTAYEWLCYQIPIDKMAFQMGNTIKEALRQHVNGHDIKIWTETWGARICHVFTQSPKPSVQGNMRVPWETRTTVRVILQVDVKWKIFWFPGEYGSDILSLWCITLTLSFLLTQQLFLFSKISDVYLELQREMEADEHLGAHKY